LSSDDAIYYRRRKEVEEVGEAKEVEDNTLMCIRMLAECGRRP